MSAAALAAVPREEVGDIAHDGENVRRLRRVRVIKGPTGFGAPKAPGIRAVVDVETTGLDPEKDAIVELAIRRFRYDGDGRITRIDRCFSWLEDPGIALPPEIVRLTGLTDEAVAGRRIDDDEAARVLGSAGLVIAHNAGFDRPFVERRLPGAAGLPWACTRAEAPWRKNGFEGWKLGDLLAQAGLFNDAHRAAGDVDSVVALLGHGLPSGRTVLAELTERSFADGWIVRASGAAFERKDELKARGCLWDGTGRVWWRKVSDA